jgi:hypothetical protein
MQENPRKTKEKPLGLLGFSWPNLGFSKGYGESKARRVADGRHEPDLRRDRVVWLYELSEAGVEDRLGVIFTRPTGQLAQRSSLRVRPDGR